MCTNTHQRPHFTICCSYKRRNRHKRGTRRGGEIDGTRRITRCAAFRGPSGGSVLSLYGVILEWRAQEGCEKNNFRCERVNVPIIKRTFFPLPRRHSELIRCSAGVFERFKVQSRSSNDNEGARRDPLGPRSHLSSCHGFFFYCNDLACCNELPCQQVVADSRLMYLYTDNFCT